ncbi:MAG TPA: SRPBCC domain-containing protein [Pseudolysinimonas sp.]|nr:SRPBCC domain-containing protein [Pseudolysinimonas sp.]
MTGIVSVSEIDIDASAAQVWGILTDSAKLGEVMFGSEVVTDWEVGGPIIYRGEWEGKPFEDKGTIVEMREPSLLVVTHYSPLGGDQDVPENYHEIRYELSGAGGRTHVALRQDGNADQAAADHSATNWDAMLASLKKAAEAS